MLSQRLNPNMRRTALFTATLSCCFSEDDRSFTSAPYVNFGTQLEYNKWIRKFSLGRDTHDRIELALAKKPQMSSFTDILKWLPDLIWKPKYLQESTYSIVSPLREKVASVLVTALILPNTKILVLFTLNLNKFKQRKLRFPGVCQRDPGQILDIC